MKNYKELQLVDNFMFCKVFGTMPELTRELLERILGEEISRVEILEYERTISMTNQRKSIRLDVYLNDAEGTIYNLEMQTANRKNLAKRSRYYQGMIDLNNLEKGANYTKLPKTIVMFICTFDYFDAGLPIYNFSNYCREDKTLELQDGTRKVFVNLRGDRNQLDKKTRALFDYFMGETVDDAFTAELQNAISAARSNQRWEVEYMEWLANEMDREIEKEEAKEEGRKEGIETGRKEGIEAGREAEKKQTTLRMHGMGMSDEQIAACLDITVDIIRNWIAGGLD